jgi:hypothetical protein
MKKLLLIPSIFLLTACVSSSGILPMGKDTYTLTVSVSDSIFDSENATKAKKEVISQSTAYCKNLNKEVLVKNMSNTTSGKTSTSSYDIVFQCVNTN